MAMRPRYARRAAVVTSSRRVDVDIQEQGSVVGGQLALAGEAVHEAPPDAPDQRFGHVREVDAHAAVLVEVAPPVVPVREQLVLCVQRAEAVDEAPVAQPGDGGPLGFGDVRSRSSGATLKSPSITIGSLGL